LPKQRVVLLVGLPASGKSTWLSDRAGVLSSDAMRALVRDDEADQTIHGLVFKLMRDFLRYRLQLGAEVTYIDATNLTRKHRRPFVKMALYAEAQVEAVYFDTPLDECLRRNAARSRVVPPEAITMLAVRLQPPTREEGFQVIQTVEP